MVASDFTPDVGIWPFRACTMHAAIIIGTVRSFWRRPWDRYHVTTERIVCFINSAEALRSKIDRKSAISLQSGQFDPKFLVEVDVPHQ